VPKVVLSKSLEGQSLPNTTIISDNIPDSINTIKFEPGKDIILFGSPTAAHSLMEHDLIDDYWLFVNPVLLGEGIPMFKSIKEKLKLRVLEAKTLGSGVVCLHYERRRSE
jgi:dihydrofolate reductase